MDSNVLQCIVGFQDILHYGMNCRQKDPSAGRGFNKDESKQTHREDQEIVGGKKNINMQEVEQTGAGQTPQQHKPNNHTDK